MMMAVAIPGTKHTSIRRKNHTQMEGAVRDKKEEREGEA